MLVNDLNKTELNMIKINRGCKITVLENLFFNCHFFQFCYYIGRFGKHETNVTSHLFSIEISENIFNAEMLIVGPIIPFTYQHVSHLSDIYSTIKHCSHFPFFWSNESQKKGPIMLVYILHFYSKTISCTCSH